MLVNHGMCTEYLHLFYLLFWILGPPFPILQGLNVPVLSKALLVIMSWVSFTCCVFSHPPTFHFINKTKQKHFNDADICLKTAFLHNQLTLLWKSFVIILSAWRMGHHNKHEGNRSLVVVCCELCDLAQPWQVSPFPDLQSDPCSRIPQLF